MAEISNMIRWNANFVRGLAQSVLERAKVIRTSLGPASTVRKAGRKAKASATKTRRARKTGG